MALSATLAKALAPLSASGHYACLDNKLKI
jgi:hypothetical protein